MHARLSGVAPRRAPPACRHCGSGEAIDLSEVTAIAFEIHDPDSRATMRSASTGNGITLEQDDADAVFTVRSASSSMQALCSKTYDVVCVITKPGNDTELFGNLAVS